MLLSLEDAFLIQTFLVEKIISLGTIKPSSQILLVEFVNDKVAIDNRSFVERKANETQCPIVVQDGTVADLVDGFAVHAHSFLKVAISERLVAHSNEELLMKIDFKEMTRNLLSQILCNDFTLLTLSCSFVGIFLNCLHKR